MIMLRRCGHVCARVHTIVAESRGDGIGKGARSSSARSSFGSYYAMGPCTLIVYTLATMTYIGTTLRPMCILFGHMDP